MADVAGSFLRGLSTGAQVRLARDQRDLNALKIKQGERDERRNAAIEDLQGELSSIETADRPAEIPVVDSKGTPGVSAGALPIETGTGETTTVANKNRSGVPDVIDMLNRALALGDEKGALAAARMLSIKGTQGFMKWKQGGDSSEFEAFANDMGMPLKKNDKGEVLSPWTDKPLAGEEMERFNMAVARWASDPIAAMKEFGSADQRAREADLAERDMKDKETKTQNDEKRNDDLWEIENERFKFLREELEAKKEISENQLEAYKAMADARAKSYSDKAVASGWGKPQFQEDFASHEEKASGILYPEDDPRWKDIKAASGIDYTQARLMTNEFIGEAMVEHGPNQGLYAEGAVAMVRFLADDPSMKDAKVEAVTGAEGQPLLFINTGQSRYPIGQNAARQAYQAARIRRSDAAKAQSNLMGPHPPVAAPSGSSAAAAWGNPNPQSQGSPNTPQSAGAGWSALPELSNPVNTYRDTIVRTTRGQ